MSEVPSSFNFSAIAQESGEATAAAIRLLWLQANKQVPSVPPPVAATPLKPGMTTAYAGVGNPDPDNYLICDGLAYSRAQYAALYDAIKETWGSGDGSTTFNVPDFRKRSIIGVDALDPVVFKVGLVGGSLSHTHTSGGAHTHPVSGSTAAEASHTHPISGPTGSALTTHNHSVSSTQENRNPGLETPQLSYTTLVDSPTGTADLAHTHTIPTPSGAGSSHLHTVALTTGSDGAHSHNSETVPYAVGTWLIKT